MLRHALLNNPLTDGLARFALKHKQRFFVVLICLLFLFLFLSLLSYNALDPAWSHYEIHAWQKGVSNIGGTLGAYSADILHRFFGIGAWFVLLWLGIEAMMQHYAHQRMMLPLRLMAYGFLWICACIVLYGLALLWHKNALQVGGIFGYEFYQALVGVLGVWALGLVGVFFLGGLYLLFDFRTLKKHLKRQKISVSERYEEDKLAPMAMPKAELRPKHADYPTGSLLSNFLQTSGIKDEILGMENSTEPAPTTIQNATIQNATIHAKAVNQTIIYQTQNTPNNAQALDSGTQNPTSLSQDALIKNQAMSSQLAPNVDSKDNVLATKDEAQTKTQEVQNTAPVSDVFDGITITKTPSFEHKNADTQIQAAFEGINLTWQTATQEEMHTQPFNEDKTKLERAMHDESKESVGFNSLALTEDDKEGDAIDEVVSVDDEHLNSQVKLKTVDTLVNTNTAFEVDKDDKEAFEFFEGFETFAVAPAQAYDDAKNSETSDEIKPKADDVVSVPAFESIPVAPKPNILDDTAFLGKSLAMQTAAYRATLSPLPSIEILDKPLSAQPSYTLEELTQLSELLEIKLKEYGVNAKVMNVMQGPVVTNFEVELAAGVKASKVTGISQDLARSLSMSSLRVVEVIAGKPYIGIEIPNKRKQIVKLIELLDNRTYQSEELDIAMAMGKDIAGEVVITDLAKAPHMLVAGTTGSGKSVLVNAMLLSMLLKYTPEALRLILIDPKMLELAPYADIPHLLTPVVTDMTEAASALSWCVGEMERRYQLMALLKVRKISEFNKKVNEAARTGTPIYDPLWHRHDSATQDKPPILKPLPLIVVVADEFADMMMQVGKQAEELIARLAQKSRAAGIHLMLATQRPSVDVVTGLIKANIPSRAALRVNSKVDSRTILDAGGAEDMLGHGDMLFLAPGKNEPIRVHGAYVTDEEVIRVTDAWRERGAPDYIDTVTSALNFPDDGRKTSKDGLDELYDEAFAFVVESGKTSISALQRHLKIGYNRSANIIESMQEQGVLSAPDSSGKRTLLL